MAMEFEISERICNVSREKQLLHLVISSETIQLEWLPRINDEIFFGNEVAAIFGLVRNMFLEKKKISFNNVRFEIKQGVATSLIDSFLTALEEIAEETPEETVDVLLDQLIQLYKSRRIYKEIFLEASREFLENRPINELIGKISNAVFAVESNVRERKIIDLPLETLDSIFNPREENEGLNIGLDEFDETYGGIKPDTYITIGAESGTGKTAILVDLIFRLCTMHREKISICFFSMEMSEERIMKRLLSRSAQVNNMKFDKKRITSITPEEKDRLYRSANLIRTWPLKIIYETMDIHSLKIKARQFVLQNPGKRHIFLVDHIGKIESSGSDMRVNTIKNSQGLKSLCIDYKATVVSLSQLLKELASDKYKHVYHRPNESHIMESGAIKADSDILILAWRPGSRFTTIAYGSNPEWDCKNKMILLNEKNRDGIEKTDMILNAYMSVSTFSNSKEPF